MTTTDAPAHRRLWRRIREPSAATGWVRDRTEGRDRRPADVVLLVLAGLGTAAAGVWAQSESGIDLNLLRPINDLTSNITDLGKVLYAVGSIWVVVGVAAALLLFRHRALVVRVALPGVVAWGIAIGLNHLLGPHDLHGLSVHVRTASGPVFPNSRVAVITALAGALGPFVVRPARRGLHVLVLAVAFAALYLGAAFPSDALGGFLLGVTVAAGALLAFGSPAGRLSPEELTAALDDLGLDVVDVHYTDVFDGRVTLATVRVSSGEEYLVQGFGRDQRDARLAAKVWHWLMYKDPSQPVFGSRLQQVEHIGYSMLLAARGGARVAEVVRTGVGGQDSGLLVMTDVPGESFDELAEDHVTDAVLGSVWEQVARLHAGGVAHGHLDPSRIKVDTDGTVGFVDFSSADATAEPRAFDRDVAAVLTASALRVGDERAVAAAVHALGPEALTAVVPILQPAALPASMSHGQRHFARRLKTLATQVSTVTGAEEVPPLKIRRLSWGTVVIAASAVIAAGFLISGMQGIDFNAVKSEFEHAVWGWAVAAAVVYPAVLAFYAGALLGAVNAEIPFIPTLLMWVSASLLNLITPNGIGGTALQYDYLRKQGVPPASAGSSLALSGTVGYVIQIVILVIAASITSSQLKLFSGNPGQGLVILVLAAAVLGLLMFIPKVRATFTDRVVPAVHRAAGDVWTVLRTPKKALMLFGGYVVADFLSAAVLGLCLMAFGQQISFAQLLVVQLGASFLASLTPVPGGVGVQEAALTGALTGFGVASAPALAAVIVFRGLTFALPPFVGFFTLRWLRKNGYV